MEKLAVDYVVAAAAAAAAGVCNLSNELTVRVMCGYCTNTVYNQVRKLL